MQNAVLFVLLCVLATPASATLFQISGTFSAGPFRAPSETPPISSLSGSFEALFDDTTVTSQIVSLTPTTASATLGTTVFDESNTEVRVFFDDFGRLSQVWWGGLAGGAANTLAPGSDDLAVAYRVTGNGSPFNVSYTADGFSETFRAAPTGRVGTLVFTVVPEPSSALLMGLGLLGLSRARARGRVRGLSVRRI